jgi:hemerythrin-like metal-binding protein
MREMRFVEWKEEYNVGVKEIDNQHRGLFSIINKLSTTGRFEPEGKYFLVTFDSLIEYARVHFATEERYMREAGYAKLSEHSQEHSRCLTELSTLAVDLKKKKPGMEKIILEYLKSWYITHILGTDRDYLESLKAKGFI